MASVASSRRQSSGPLGVWLLEARPRCDPPPAGRPRRRLTTDWEPQPRDQIQPSERRHPPWLGPWDPGRWRLREAVSFGASSLAARAECIGPNGQRRVGNGAVNSARGRLGRRWGRQFLLFGSTAHGLVVSRAVAARAGAPTHSAARVLVVAVVVPWW